MAVLEMLRCASEAALSETVADFVISQRQARGRARRAYLTARRDRGLAHQVAPGLAGAAPDR